MLQQDASKRSNCIQCVTATALPDFRKLAISFLFRVHSSIQLRFVSAVDSQLTSIVRSDVNWLHHLESHMCFRRVVWDVTKWARGQFAEEAIEVTYKTISLECRIPLIALAFAQNDETYRSVEWKEDFLRWEKNILSDQRKGRQSVDDDDAVKLGRRNPLLREKIGFFWDIENSWKSTICALPERHHL